jgi:DNA-binding MarR family transcriptional regulator
MVTVNKEKMNPPQRAPRREELVYLEIMRTADALSRGLVPLFKREKISPTQYNVLRILRGSPGGLPCGEIANRMITRDPDMTRLLDRMEKRGLISRCRGSEDRRTVTATITAAGRELLTRLDEPLQSFHRQQLGHMSVEGLRQLARLLQAARG